MAEFGDPAFYGDRWADVYDEHHGWLDPAAAVEFLAGLAGDGRVLELAIPDRHAGWAGDEPAAGGAAVRLARRAGPDGRGGRPPAGRALRRLGPAAVRLPQRQPHLRLPARLT